MLFNRDKLVLRSTANPDEILSRFRSSAAALRPSAEPFVGVHYLAQTTPDIAHVQVCKIDGPNVELEYFPEHGKRFGQQMLIHVESANGGGSIILARYSLPLLLMVAFLPVIIVPAVVFTIMFFQALKEPHTWPIAALVPVFTVGIIAFVRLAIDVESKNLEAYLRSLLADAEDYR